jgi:hypothetical protein
LAELALELRREGRRRAAVELDEQLAGHARLGQLVHRINPEVDLNSGHRSL